MTIFTKIHDLGKLETTKQAEQELRQATGVATVNSKITGTVPCCLALQLSEARHGGSHVGQKHKWEKIVLNFYFSWTVNSNKYAVLTILSSTLLRTKKKTVKKIRNLGEVFHNRLRVLSLRGLG